MRSSTSCLLSFVCAAAALAAQGDKPDKPGKGPPAKPAAKAPKDDAITAKDPVIVALDKFAATKVSKKSPDWRTSLPQPPAPKFANGTQYTWHMETNKGDVVIHLFADTAPMHVASAIYLVRLGYYDGLSFHRVIPEFMAQGGCPTGTGNGGPGYQMAGEFDGGRKHDKPGLLSAANSGPGTDGSQLFLTFVPTPHLDGKHTIYGEVVSGMETLKALEACGSESGRPTGELLMVRSWITVLKDKTATIEVKAPDKPKGDQGK